VVGKRGRNHPLLNCVYPRGKLKRGFWVYTSNREKVCPIIRLPRAPTIRPGSHVGRYRTAGSGSPRGKSAGESPTPWRTMGLTSSTHPVVMESSGPVSSSLLTVLLK
jgi:hypothetical protein